MSENKSEKEPWNGYCRVCHAPYVWHEDLRANTCNCRIVREHINEPKLTKTTHDPGMEKKLKVVECSHDFSMDDEFQHYDDQMHSDRFWFTMRCDLCHKLFKVYAEINWDRSEEIKEEN